MKIFVGDLPAISPEYGCINGESFDDHICVATSHGWQQILPAGLTVTPAFAAAIRAGLAEDKPAHDKKAKK